MPDTKVTDLTSATPISTDILYLVDDPGGAPLSKKATVQEVVYAGLPYNAASIYHSVAQAIVTATWTYMTADSERWDYGTMHDNAVNNSRITAQVNGIYDGKYQIVWASGGTGDRAGALDVNRAGQIWAGQRWGYSVTSDEYCTASSDFELVATDYIEVKVRHNRGVNLNCTLGKFSLRLVYPQ